MRRFSMWGKNSSHTILADILEQSQPFNLSNGYRSSNLTGRTDYWGMGQLDYVYKDAVFHADYIIYSYATPIAWRKNGVWTMPDACYSVTTSKHQGRVRAAIHNLKNGDTVNV